MNDLTEIALVHQPGQLEQWVRFGRHTSERILDRRRRLLLFKPHETIAFVRWASNAYGTVDSRLDIVRTVEPGAAFTALPFVRPGAEALLSVTGWPKVATVLKLIDTAEATAGDAAAVCPAYWGHIHLSLASGLQAKPYLQARHRAWSLRRDLNK